MAIPILSTVTLFTELIISAIIVYIFYSSYFHNRFPYRLAFFALAYEVIFNVSYMAYRAFRPSQGLEDTGFIIGLAIFHGVLSLIMFVSLVVFFVLAWRAYSKGINYFKKNKVLTIIFLILWFIAVISGILFYFAEYF